MRVTGFSLVANAVTLDFPIREALRSILPLCDEVVVNVGPSEDGTRELITAMNEPRIRILDGAWERGQGSGVLAVETQRALDALSGDWAIYIQADEVLHEDGLAPLGDAMAGLADHPGVEGLLVDFVHCYGGPDWVGTGRAWYRREVRVVRTGRGVRSFRDAQGFRVGEAGRRIRARRSGASWFHYGWARTLSALGAKRMTDNALYHAGAERRGPYRGALPWEVGLRRFTGRHPAVMTDWLARRATGGATAFAPSPWTPRRLAILASLGVERLTGWRPFEYRNYVEV